MNKKMKPYPKYKKTNILWLTEVPEGWEIRKINELFRERREKVSDTDYPALSVSKGGVVPQMKNVAKSNDGENRKLVKKGDFAINSRSDRKGSSGISKYGGSVSLINTVLTPRNNIDGQFLHHLLKSHNFVEEFYRNGRGIVADLWTTRFTEMKTIVLPLPPLPTQAQIVRFLDWKVAQINKLISAKKKQLELLQEQQHVVIQSVFDGISAESVPCRHLAIFQNGISESGNFFIDGDYPFVNYGDVYKNGVLPIVVQGTAKSNTKQKVTYSILEGDIIFTRTSETIDEVGLTSVCYKTIDNAVFSGFLIRMRPKQGVLDKRYSRYYFRSKRVRDYFTKEMNSVTRASLGQNLLKNLPVLLPELSEQQIIAEKLDIKTNAFDKLTNTIKKEIFLFQEYRTRLISDTVTGKIDVHGIEIPEFDETIDIIEEHITENILENE
jgi:type I restriction enzyme S subunit